jgi:hypothetical protein
MAKKKKDKQEDIFNQLVSNAFDFLDRALNEFEGQTKHSIIDFYSATELFLKARLMKEHWTLTLSGLSGGDSPKNGKNILQKFKQGDFHSVTLDQSIGRLKNIVGIDLSGPEFSAFDKIRNERNKAVHFYPSKNNNTTYREQLAEDQLIAWYFLHKLISNEWKELFEPWREKVTKIEEKLISLKKFLLVKYKNIKPDIEIRKKNKENITNCPSCDYEAVTHAPTLDTPYTSTCLVCGFGELYIKSQCPDCDQEILFSEEIRKTCGECGKNIEPEDLVMHFANTSKEDFDYKDSTTYAQGIHCEQCDGYETVIFANDDAYICLNCFDRPDTISNCDHCGDLVSGDAEDSIINGCPACDGFFRVTAST